MENNEIMMNEEIEVMDDAVVADEGTGVGTGVAMLIGAGLTLAVGAGVRAAKNLYAKYKAKKKETESAGTEPVVEPENVVEEKTE